MTAKQGLALAALTEVYGIVTCNVSRDYPDCPLGVSCREDIVVNPSTGAYVG